MEYTQIANDFNLGNYVHIVREGTTQQWQTYAALGLIGKTDEAIAGLEEFSCQESQFYLAVTYWIGGDDNTAQNLLKDIQTPHAQNLLNLIRKPRIEVLAQLPWTRSAPHDLLGAAISDSKFQVQNISFHPKDLQNYPYADIHNFYNRQKPPDFYICSMVEWHLIPPNLQELPCPILGQTADYDLHIQAVYPWFQLFDEFVVTDHTEWADVCKLVKVPVSTFPKSFGLSVNLPPLIHHPRPIDVFISGTTLHPYHPDKAHLYHQVLQISGIRPLFVNGFMSQEQYYEFLAKSKLCFTHVRHSGATPTRGLEALSMGCVVAVQQDCVLQLFANESHGVVPYEHNHLAEAVHYILKHYERLEKAAQQGAKLIREEFSLPKVASQYLRFLTFLAAKPRPQRSYENRSNLAQKRSVLQKGWLPGDTGILEEISKKNLQHWQNEQFSLYTIIDTTRELVLEYAYALKNGRSASNAELLAKILELYRQGVKQFPQSLVLHFNFIRVCLHFGQSQEISEALQLAQSIFIKPINEWQIDVMEDIFPWDVYSQFFNYRRYFDLITEELSQQIKNVDILKKLILASLRFYYSKYARFKNDDEILAHLYQATKLDSSFPYYQMAYAEQLVNSQKPENLEQAKPILLELAQNSLLFMEAYELLYKLYGSRVFRYAELDKLNQAITQADRYTVFLDNSGIQNLQQLSLSRVNSFQDNYQVIKQQGQSEEINLSLILLGWDEDVSLKILNQLSQQTISREQYEIIWIGLGIHESIQPEIMSHTDTLITFDSQDMNHKHIAYNIGLLHANGSVLVLLENDASFKEDFISAIFSVFNLNSSQAPSQVVLTSRNRTYTAFRKVDAIRLGGFDEQGDRGSMYTLIHRLTNAGLREISLDENNPSLAMKFISWDFWIWRLNYFKLLPYSENSDIRQLRLSLTRLPGIFSRVLRHKVGLSKASGLTIFKSQLFFSLDSLILERNLLGMMGKPRKAHLLVALRKLIGNTAYDALKRWWHILVNK